MARDPRWYVIQVHSQREVRASVEIASRDFPVFVPTIAATRRHARKTEIVSVPRFPGYIFAKFDRAIDDWGALTREPSCKRAGIVSVLCNGSGNPSPVPPKAMVAIRAYAPPADNVVVPAHVYIRGEPVKAYIGGVPKDAIFLDYAGRGAKVELWILGSPRTTSIALSALEPDIGRLTWARL